MKRKTIISIILLLTLCFISIYVFTRDLINLDNKMEIRVYSLEEIESIMNELDKQNCNIEYIAESESISNKTFVNKTVQLTSEYKYGKAFYTNNSPKDVTLNIDRTNISIIVPAWKSIGTTWTKSGIGNKTYTVSISSDGSTNLIGKISVAKSNTVIH